MSAESLSNARIEEVSRSLFAERKRKNPSNDVVSPKNRYDADKGSTIRGTNLIIFSLLKRRLSKKYGLDFTIRGKNGTEWKMSLQNAAVSTLIEETCVCHFSLTSTFTICSHHRKQLAHANPVHYIDIPSRFDAGTIDILVNFMLWAGYNIEDNFKLLNVEDAAYHNAKLKAGFDRIVPIVQHIKVRDLGKYMQIPELMDAALEQIQQILSSRSKPLSIEVFKEVVQHTWGWEDNLVHEDDIDVPVAQMGATFGATLDPLWRLTDPELLDEMASFEGKCKTYAVWHSDAKRYNDKMSREAIAPFVRKLMDEYVDSMEVEGEDKENMW